ncbi:MAG TPA: PP2C family protein-serine/threonine phosphatase [Acidobacteriaceae bacterium]|nr:PP2C family protein-serine/threonine phosphatase [Acidobacteriaceae bacterium]
MTNTHTVPTIDEYLRQRLTPVEGAIPQIPGIEMYGNSIPAETVGGDLFEYINFQQRYDIEARIQRAQRLAKEFLEPLPPGDPTRNSVDDHVEWLKGTAGYLPEMEAEYRFAKSSEQVRVAEDLPGLYSTAGILIVDAQGHGIISAKIASTVHDTFHALLLDELDRYGKTTPELFENLNLRLALSATARNTLGVTQKERSREVATLLYGEVHPNGTFRFANFGHPPPLVFSAESSQLLNLSEDQMAQFLALGLQLPADHPDRRKYFSLNLRKRKFNACDVAEITLSNPGDILVLYTDGVYDGSDDQGREQLESILLKYRQQSARDICNAVMDYAIAQDEQLRRHGDEALIDDKTVFIVKRTE